MVSAARAPVRVDRLRSLNLPRRVTVTVGEQGLPTSVHNPNDAARRGEMETAAGPGPAIDEDSRSQTAVAGTRHVVAIGEVWRVDDEWWRQPVARRCVEVILEGGAHLMLFEDLTTGDWFAQRI